MKLSWNKLFNALCKIEVQGGRNRTSKKEKEEGKEKAQKQSVVFFQDMCT